MSDLTRLVSAALIAAMLVMAGMPARADDRSNPAASESWWDSVRGGPKDIFDYGLLTIRSLADWVTGGTPNPSDGKTEDIRSLLNLSDKEFREFDALIHAAGFVLQNYSFGLGGSSDVELTFDFERTITEPERFELHHQMEQQGSTAIAVHRSIILGLLDANRYRDASPAGGYRLSGVTMRLGSPPDVRVRFQRSKP